MPKKQQITEQSGKFFTDCKNHGFTEFFYSSYEHRYRCKKCRSDRVQKCRKRAKPILVKEFGGCCEICGYSKCLIALEFHHVFPETKEFGIAEDGWTYSLTRKREEAKKCVLLCSNCHREVESKITIIPQNLIDRVRKNIPESDNGNRIRC